ncbi:unnamed protein product [Camellia sinensis]
MMQDIFDLYSFVKVCILLHFRCHQIPFMWGIVGMVIKFWIKPEFFLSSVYFLGGPRVSIYSGQSGNAFYAAL